MNNKEKNKPTIEPKDPYPFLKNYQVETYELSFIDSEKDNELRIQLEENEIIKITLENGSAEIEGSDIPLKTPICKENQNFAIFTWDFAEIKIQGNQKHPNYSAKNELMIKYLNANKEINEKRNICLKEFIPGPKIIVLGSEKSGKTTLCHILSNYALKFGWKPIYVDLDLNNEISLPGLISATTVDYNLPNNVMIENSISYFHGYKGSEINFDLYEKQVRELSSVINLKISEDIKDWKEQLKYDEVKLKYLKENLHQEVFISPSTPTEYASGVIINCQTIKDTKNDFYKNMIDIFDCSHIFVIDHERLYEELNRKYNSGNNNVRYISSSGNTNLNFENQSMKKKNIVKLSKSGGVIQLERNIKSEQIRFSNYFDGPFGNFRFNEHTINLGEYKLLKIKSTKLDKTIMTIGETTLLKLFITELNKYNIREENIINKIIALPHIDQKVLDDLETDFSEKINKKIDEFINAPISYLARVKQMEIINDAVVIKIYAPFKELDPKNKYFMIGDIKYVN